MNVREHLLLVIRLHEDEVQRSQVVLQPAHQGSTILNSGGIGDLGHTGGWVLPLAAAARKDEQKKKGREGGKRGSRCPVMPGNGVTSAHRTSPLPTIRSL